MRLRGLPFAATPEDVLSFFSGLEVLRGPAGVVFTWGRDGRPLGEAYVEFPSEEIQLEALKRDREKMGPRYVEIFKSTKADMLMASILSFKPSMLDILLLHLWDRQWGKLASHGDKHTDMCLLLSRNLVSGGNLYCSGTAYGDVVSALSSCRHVNLSLNASQGHLQCREQLCGGRKGGAKLAKLRQ